MVEALPELARAAADAWVKTAWWSLAVSLKVGTRLARVALDPGAAVELAQEFSDGVRNYAREFLGIADLDGQVRELAPPPRTFSNRGQRNGRLREQGAELLRAAADVDAERRGPSGVRPDPRRARARRGPHPAAAGATTDPSRRSTSGPPT